MQATNVLRRTLEAEREYKIILHEGGSRSSKTFSIFQFFILKAIAGENLRITIARDKLTWIKTTLLKDFEDIVKLYDIKVTPEINPNRSDQIYYINGTEFAFFGLDKAQKLHGRKQDWFWLNEVMEVSQKHFDQLEMRTNIGGIIDYNPVDDTHWIFKLQLRPDVTVIKSTMLDNPFLPDTIIRKILSYEPTEENIRQGTADSYMWAVYGKGEKAKLKGVVFENWDIVPDIPKNAKSIGLGLDFGYTNDPTAIVDLYLFNHELYIDELLYQTELTNPKIVKILRELDIDESEEITADSAEPKSIEEIKNSGFNIKGVDKGPDSVSFGIDLLKGYKIHITKNSINLERELRRYKWAEDKNGDPIKRNGKGVPIDAYNHAIDALRYRAMKVLKKRKGVKLYPSAMVG